MTTGGAQKSRGGAYTFRRLGEANMRIDYTTHARQRSHQRGVPPLITSWLLDYGVEEYDGHGAIIRYFTRESLRKMERELSSAPLKRLSEFLSCYLVQSNQDGAIITVGKRHAKKRIWRH
jgi:hypothetical protein